MSVFVYLILLVPTHVEDLMMPVRTHMNGPTAHHPTSQVVKYRKIVVMEPSEVCPKANPARMHFIMSFVFLILLAPTHVEDLMMPERTHMYGPQHTTPQARS